MKRLYQLAALSMMTGVAPAFSQELKPIVQQQSTNSQLMAMNVIRAERMLVNVNPADIAISGKVTDEKGSGLPGVSVVVKGSTSGTTTDPSGSFRISVPNTNSTLVFSFVGYGRKEVVVGNQTNLTVSLTPDDQTLNEVVVVGYGSQLKKEITGAVQTISAAEIKDLPVTQIGQKLQGRLAGVQINQATGKPGQGISIRIRGQVSVSAGSDPLYVIDGFPNYRKHRSA